MEFKKTTDTSSPIYKDALKIRKKVFIEEQSVDEALEIDELENKTTHLVGYSENSPCCTARLYLKDPAHLKIQRVAVLKDYRNKGIGKALLEEIESVAQHSFAARYLVLDSQDHAISFYEKSGYEASGEGFLDAGIPHHHMQKEIAAR
ncbi:GNAT family N-acetyltransferase [Alkalibacterium sp.]|nr:MAG: GNAT family N-acetyltransferase [Alkalibacterium sp.]